MKLSMCIATFNRAGFIGQTLDSILPQLTSEVELVVVDGASTDGTADVVAAYRSQYPSLVYHREKENSGFDRDVDKAVTYARGQYCWLMSDDDILADDAIATVLKSLADGPALVVVNAEVRSKDLSKCLKERQLNVGADQEFAAEEQANLFAVTTNYLSFFGAVVIQRDRWLARERAPYFGSMFIHVGVIFQSPSIGRAKLIARPLIKIRYANAMWTARAFEIWAAKWPRLIWSFDQFSTTSRAGVTQRYPATSLKLLLHYRALGAYGPGEYRSLLAGRDEPHHPLAIAVAWLPARGVNAAIALSCLLRRHVDAPMMLHDLVRARCASSLARWISTLSSLSANGK
ncbi:glycosyltransferase [uncultured Ramlibacter sp.]|uniref:glycosyltransferase family 2 protein n=1 Tax=uncultured Ramlibacter sp. TaxID=260755 RepID=UPI002602C258|nr:glycosyltransferase [uncultured Ramlibacter sp.]